MSEVVGTPPTSSIISKSSRQLASMRRSIATLFPSPRLRLELSVYQYAGDVYISALLRPARSGRLLIV